MYPGSFIWRFISDEWLVSRRAAWLFAFFSTAVAGMTVALNSSVIPHRGAPAAASWALGGVLAGFGIFFVWGGMWRYWIARDPSPRRARRVWFLILFVGIWYGAILYYLAVYLPTIGRNRGAAEEGLTP